MILNKTVEPMHSHRSRHREWPTWPHSDNHTPTGYWEINGVKAHCRLDSRSEGVLLSLEFTQATGIKTFALEKPIALQLACISSRLMINYGTHVTIKAWLQGSQRILRHCKHRTLRCNSRDPISKKNGDSPGL